MKSSRLMQQCLLKNRDHTENAKRLSKVTLDGNLRLLAC